MKVFLKFLSVFSLFLVFNYNVALAQDIEAGSLIFSANCAACHANGNNVILNEKTLKIDVLQKNSMDSIEAITTQVTNGKNAMPAFGDRLSGDDIINLANFVLNQATTESW